MKGWLFFCLMISCRWIEASVSIQVDDSCDYEVLDCFFRMGLADEEYGYVLDGVKPIATRQFYALDVFPIPRDFALARNEFEMTLLVRRAIEVWNRLCTKQDKFVLKAVPVVESDPLWCGFEVQFIHVPALRKVIHDNIALFHYVLGSQWSEDDLLKRFTHSQERFQEIVQDDLTLIGIVLGFGTHNSVVGGRLESISRATLSWDLPPFVAHSSFFREEGDEWRYGLHYLECNGGQPGQLNKQDRPIVLRAPFTHLKEEVLALEAQEEPLPPLIQCESPRFVFGAFRGDGSNKELFKKLRKSQLATKNILKGKAPLEKILELIGGKKPKITCQVKSDSHGLKLSLSEWSSLVGAVEHRLSTPEDKKAFRKALAKTDPVRPPAFLHLNRATLDGVNKALANLSAADAYCSALSQDKTWKTLVPQTLYEKTTQPGHGEPIRGVSQVRLRYTMRDQKGEVLSACYDTWFDLHEVIPGLRQGVQGMRLEEKRTLCIHPALGYGALTTLPPCSLLLVDVELLEVDLGSSLNNLPLSSFDFTWLKDPRLAEAVKQSIDVLPEYIASFYRELAPSE